MYYIGMVITYTQQSMDQPGKVANPARCQLNRENELFLCPARRVQPCLASACSFSIVRLNNLVLIPVFMDGTGVQLLRGTL